MNLKEESISKRKYNLNNWGSPTFPSPSFSFMPEYYYYDLYLDSKSHPLKKLEFGDNPYTLNNYSEDDKPTYMTVIKSVNVNLKAISIKSYTEYNLEDEELTINTRSRSSDLFPVRGNRMYVVHDINIEAFWKLSFSEFNINGLYSMR